MSLQLKTLIVQVIKTLTELLGKGGTQWTNGEVCHRDLTNLLAEYQTYDCMEPSPPFASKAACGTFLRNIRHLLCPVVLQKEVWEWVNGNSAPVGMKERLEVLFSQSQNMGAETMLSGESNSFNPLNSSTSSQPLGEAVLSARGCSTSPYCPEVQGFDTVEGKEPSKPQPCEVFRKAIGYLQTLLQGSRRSFVMNPRSVTLGDGPPKDSLDHGPLYLTLEQVRAFKRRQLLLATSMTGDLQEDELSAVLIRNLLDGTSKLSGPNVAETEPTSGGRTRDAGDLNKPANDPPASAGDLAPAA